VLGIWAASVCALLLLASCGERSVPLSAAGSDSDPTGETVHDLQDGPGAMPGTNDGDVTTDGQPPGTTDIPGGDVGGGTPIVLPTPAGADPDQPGTYLDLDAFPLDAIRSGGPAKDAIPALTNPPFAGPGAVSYLSDSDLVLGVVINGEAKAYPHNIGWWHEIVNDRVGGKPVSVTFCPLTGTGLVFDAEDEDGGQFELGVSGLLFNTNLIMYDRRDDSTLYPQIAHRAVRGERRGEILRLLPVVETTWATWQRLHPSTTVVERGTYSLSRYQSYPYGDYRTDDSYFIFALTPALASNQNEAARRLRAKERVLGVRLDGQTKAYPFSALPSQAALNDQVGGVDLVVVWDRAANLAIPYARQVGDQVLTFDVEQDGAFPMSLRDRETRSLWNVNGLALSGPLAGRQLVQVPAHSSMWFAWVTFWQDTEVWQ
jgi:hypothetical protein